MPGPDSEEVDAFGRTIVRSKPPSANYGPPPRSAGPPPRNMDNRQRRSRSRSPYGRGGNRGYPQRNHGYPPQDDQQRYYYENPAPVMEVPPSSTSLLAPVMSYRSFIASQREDLPPDAYQQLYDAYNKSYLNDFSDAFFRVSMSEEWFQDRYNPAHLLAADKDAAAWAIEESASFKASLSADPAAFIASCSLEPQAVSRADSGRHLPGHEHRTVFISSVHACCPKAVFQAAVTAALSSLSAESECPEQPLRVLVGQPVWSRKHMNRFERSAWVVLPSASAAARAVSLLHHLEVKVPGPPDSKGDIPTAFAFQINACLHACAHPQRTVTALPDFLSHSSAVRADIVKAAQAAALLDEQKDIPADQRLQALLANASDAIQHPTAHLDLSLAYLRRVHLVAFYAGRRFRDEAHLLAVAPAPAHRAIAFVPDAELDAVPYTVTTEEVQSRKRRLSEAEPQAEAAEPKAAADGRTSRIDLLIASLLSKPHNADAEDAVLLLAAQERSYDAAVARLCSFEGDGKCRCCYEYCRKLFKAVDFLTKHIRVKHPDFAMEDMLREAEPMMRKRYEAEDITARPLPPIEVIEGHGRIELRSVSEMLDRMSKSAAAPTRQTPQDRDSNRRFTVTVGGEHERRLSREQPPALTVPNRQVHPLQQRKVANYMDVDVPKESVVSIDYGVAVMPPTKKRRSLGGAKAVAAAAAAAGAAVPASNGAPPADATSVSAADGAAESKDNNVSSAE